MYMEKKCQLKTFFIGILGLIASILIISLIPLKIQNIKEKKSFDTLKTEYARCQKAYEHILILNQKMESANEKDKKRIATDYQSLASDIQTLYKEEQQITMSPRLESARPLILQFLDTAQQYCSLMASGTIQNNANDLESALTLWSGGTDNQTGSSIKNLPDQFTLLQKEVVNLGKTYFHEDMTTISEWNPNAFVDEIANKKK